MKKYVKIITLTIVVLTVFLTFSPGALALSESSDRASVIQDGFVMEENPWDTLRPSLFGTETWLTGRFNGNAYSTKHRLLVTNTSSWWSIKFKVYTYYADGDQSKGKVIIRITTPEDPDFVYITRVESGATITVPKGYTRYDVQIKRNGTGYTNVSRCYYWAYKATSNCGWCW